MTIEVISRKIEYPLTAKDLSYCRAYEGNNGMLFIGAPGSVATNSRLAAVSIDGKAFIFQDNEITRFREVNIVVSIK